jgi:hypothetical protein
MGVTLEPPPFGASPVIDARAALAAVREDGMQPEIQQTIDPIVRLASFTNPILGQTGGPPFGPPKYADVLVWDVVYPDAPVELHGPVGSSNLKPDPCDLHVIVDATTAKIIEGFQASCHVNGNDGPTLVGSAPTN